MLGLTSRGTRLRWVGRGGRGGPGKIAEFHAHVFTFSALRRCAPIVPYVRISAKVNSPCHSQGAKESTVCAKFHPIPLSFELYLLGTAALRAYLPRSVTYLQPVVDHAHLFTFSALRRCAPIGVHRPIRTDFRKSK